MALYQTGAYQVRPTAVEKVKKAIVELVRYVTENEPGTQMVYPPSAEVVFTDYEMIAGKR